MVTIRDGLESIQVDNNRHVFAKGAHGQPPRIEYLTTTTGNIKPGMPVIRGTTVGISSSCAEAGGTSILVYGIAEWDEKQIADCDTTYASGDVIPVIPIFGNEGAWVRNLHITDPNTDIVPDQGWQSGNAVWVVGDATGAIYIRALFFIADADNPTQMCGYIAPSLDIAA